MRSRDRGASDMSTVLGVGLTFVLPAVLLGVVVAGAGGYLWLESNEVVQRAEPTNATVTSSFVAETSGQGESAKTYRPAISYEYTVDGESYRSSNVMPGRGDPYRSDRSWAERIVADHPEGATVTAYYDPDNPQNAFLLKKQRSLLPLLLGGTGAVSVLLGLVALIAVLVWARR